MGSPSVAARRRRERIRAGDSSRRRAAGAYRMRNRSSRPPATGRSARSAA